MIEYEVVEEEQSLPLAHVEDKDSTLEGFEDFDPDAESSLSISFVFSRKGGGYSTHTVYLDEKKLKNKHVLTRLQKIQVAAVELLLIGEKL
jgi:hypothetical protein